MALPTNGINDFLAESGETEDERRRRQWLAGQVEDAPSISIPEGWAADAAAYFGIPLANDNESGNPYDDTLVGPRPWKPQDVLPFLAGIDQIPTRPEDRFMNQAMNFLPLPFVDEGIKAVGRLGKSALSRLIPETTAPQMTRSQAGLELNHMKRELGIPEYYTTGSDDADRYMPGNITQIGDDVMDIGSTSYDRPNYDVTGQDLNMDAMEQLQNFKRFPEFDPSELTAPPKGPGGPEPFSPPPDWEDAVRETMDEGPRTPDTLKYWADMEGKTPGPFADDATGTLIPREQGPPEPMLLDPNDQYLPDQGFNNTMDFNTFLDQGVLEIPPWAKRIRDNRWRQN